MHIPALRVYNSKQKQFGKPSKTERRMLESIVVIFMFQARDLTTASIVFVKNYSKPTRNLPKIAGGRLRLQMKILELDHLSNSIISFVGAFHRPPVRIFWFSEWATCVPEHLFKLSIVRTRSHEWPSMWVATHQPRPGHVGAAERDRHLPPRPQLRGGAAPLLPGRQGLRHRLCQAGGPAVHTPGLQLARPGLPACPGPEGGAAGELLHDRAGYVYKALHYLRWCSQNPRAKSDLLLAGLWMPGNVVVKDSFGSLAAAPDWRPGQWSSVCLALSATSRTLQLWFNGKKLHTSRNYTGYHIEVRNFKSVLFELTLSVSSWWSI